MFSYTEYQFHFAAKLTPGIKKITRLGMNKTNHVSDSSIWGPLISPL